MPSLAVAPSRYAGGYAGRHRVSAGAMRLQAAEETQQEKIDQARVLIDQVCNTLQHTATHCNTLQHTATQCAY